MLDNVWNGRMLLSNQPNGILPNVFRICSPTEPAPSDPVSFRSRAGSRNFD
jgi:hypothetical protein